MAKLKSKNQIITNAVRCSYVNLFEAGKPGEMNEGKYSVSLIIPKSDVDTLKVIREAITNVFKENETSKLKGVTFDKARSILHDGDIERPEGISYKADWKGQTAQPYMTPAYLHAKNSGEVEQEVIKSIKSDIGKLESGK